MADIHHHNKKPLSNDADPLLILRGIACLMVVVSHCNPPKHSIIYQNYDLSWLIFAPGYVAVWIFFCLSGYLIGKGFYLERYLITPLGIIKFLRNRSVRILPLYFFAILILSLFVYTDILKFENWSYLFRLSTFSYQPYINLDANSAFFNPAFWSLSTEVQFYLLAPFIYSLLSFYLKSHIRVLLFVLILFGIIAFIKYCILLLSSEQNINNTGYMFTYFLTPLYNNLDLFICGLLVNALIKYNHAKINFFNKKTSKLYLKYLSIALIIGLCLYSQYYSYQQVINVLYSPNILSLPTFVIQPLTAILTSIFIYAFEVDNYYSYTQNQKLSFQTIRNNLVRALEILGILSYGIYLWHFPIIDRVTPIFISDVPITAFLLRLSGALFLSIILSTCTYYLVELPAVKWKSTPDKPKI